MGFVKILSKKLQYSDITIIYLFLLFMTLKRNVDVWYNILICSRPLVFGGMGRHRGGWI